MNGIFNSALSGVANEVGKQIGKNIAHDIGTTSNQSQCTDSNTGKKIFLTIGGLFLAGLLYKAGSAFVDTGVKEWIKYIFFVKRQGFRRCANSAGNNENPSIVNDSIAKQPVEGRSIAEMMTNGTKPESKKEQLISEFQYKGELGFFIGTPDSGKSLTLMGEAYNIATGRASFLDPDAQIHDPYPVDYYSLELDEDDLKTRYKHNLDNVMNFKILYLSDFMEGDVFENIIDDILARIECAKEDKVIMLDNLSKITNTTNPEMVRDVYNKIEMATVRAKKRGVAITVIVVMHTNREVEPDKPITERHIGASWDAVKLAKCLFVIAPGMLGDNYRYIKNLKHKYGSKSDTVAVVKIVEEPFLHAEFVGYKAERECLRPNGFGEYIIEKPLKRGPQSTISPETKARVIEMVKDKVKYEKIANEVGISLSSVKRIAAEYKKQVAAMGGQKDFDDSGENCED